MKNLNTRSPLMLVLVGLLFAGGTPAFAAEDMAKKLEEIRMNVDELRAQQLLNIFSFSADMSMRYDNLNVNRQTDTSISATTLGTVAGAIAAGGSPFNKTIQTGTVTVSNAALAGAFLSAYGGFTGNPPYNETNNYYRIKTNLNIQATGSRTMQFHSRLTASKFVNAFSQQGYANSQEGSLDGPNNYQSDQIWLARAYVDWMVGEQDVLSIGRLPTTDGPPAHLPDGRARLGTYPSISYNNFVDGIGYTHSVKNMLPQNHLLNLRALFTPFGNTNLGGPYTAAAYTRAPWVGAGNGQLGAQGQTSMNMYVLEAEYSVRATRAFENMNIMAQYMNTGSGTFNSNSTAPTQSGNNGDPTDSQISLSESTLAVEFDGLANLPFDVSLSYNYTNVNGSGTNYLPIPVQGTTSSLPMTTVVYVPFGGFGCSPAVANGGLGCTRNYNGGNTLLSLRYKLIPSAYMGGEYSVADPGNFYYAGGDDTLTKAYGTHGQMYHLYWTQMFTPTTSLRIGGFYQNVSNQPIFFSMGAEPVATYVTNYYANFRVDF